MLTGIAEFGSVGPRPEPWNPGSRNRPQGEENREQAGIHRSFDAFLWN